MFVLFEINGSTFPVSSIKRSESGELLIEILSPFGDSEVYKAAPKVSENTENSVTVFVPAN